jgi:hypothetical protein
VPVLKESHDGDSGYHVLEEGKMKVSDSTEDVSMTLITEEVADSTLEVEVIQDEKSDLKEEVSIALTTEVLESAVVQDQVSDDDEDTAPSVDEP